MFETLTSGDLFGRYPFVVLFNLRYREKVKEKDVLNFSCRVGEFI